MIAGANDGGAGIKDQHAQHISGSMEIWRLCRQYTVVQAALLIAGYDPGSVSQVEQQRPEERPRVTKLQKMR